MHLLMAKMTPFFFGPLCSMLLRLLLSTLEAGSTPLRLLLLMLSLSLLRSHQCVLNVCVPPSDPLKNIIIPLVLVLFLRSGFQVVGFTASGCHRFTNFRIGRPRFLVVELLLPCQTHDVLWCCNSMCPSFVRLSPEAPALVRAASVYEPRKL